MHGKTTVEHQGNGFARNISETFETLQVDIKRAQIIQAESGNSNRISTHRYPVSDKVWLATRNLETECPYKKLDWTQIGPCTIKWMVSPYIYELALPRTMKFHPIFHIFLLTLATQNLIPGQHQSPPAPVEVER